MECSFKVGDKVVFVGEGKDPSGPNPVYGEVYTVAWIGFVSDGTNVDLIELPSPETDDWYRGYKACRFRPVITRSTDKGMSILRGLLDSKKAGKPEKVDA